jgi:hypothetical protein
MIGCRVWERKEGTGEEHSLGMAMEYVEEKAGCRRGGRLWW